MCQKAFAISLLLALLQAGPAQGGESPASVRVEAGDISATAQGDGARASVSIGALPSKPGCATAEVKVGNIQKSAIGRNAAALVTIPEPNANCEEKHP